MNQHFSPKASIIARLHSARWLLALGELIHAQFELKHARAMIDMAPTSTRRRWKVGK